MPPIGDFKALAMEKVCPICQSDNSKNAVSCVNCGASLKGIKVNIKNRQRDEEGSGIGQNKHIEVNKQSLINQNKTFIPGFNTVQKQSQAISQNQNNKDSAYPFNSTNNKTKPINNKTMISDDDVEIADEEHLRNIKNSADSLGL